MIPTPPQPTDRAPSCFYFLDDSNGFLGGDNEIPIPSPTANIFGRFESAIVTQGRFSNTGGFWWSDHPTKPQQWSTAQTAGRAFKRPSQRGAKWPSTVYFWSKRSPSETPPRFFLEILVEWFQGILQSNSRGKTKSPPLKKRIFYPFLQKRFKTSPQHASQIAAIDHSQ